VLVIGTWSGLPACLQLSQLTSPLCPQQLSLLLPMIEESSVAGKLTPMPDASMMAEGAKVTDNANVAETNAAMKAS